MLATYNPLEFAAMMLAMPKEPLKIITPDHPDFNADLDEIAQTLINASAPGRKLRGVISVDKIGGPVLMNTYPGSGEKPFNAPRCFSVKCRSSDTAAVTEHRIRAAVKIAAIKSSTDYRSGKT
jgi:hypothetical protein